MTSTLLVTKLLAPPLREGQISRPRLHDLLDTALEAGCKLILVSAPAGFGKTTALNAWLQSLRVTTSSEARPTVESGRVSWLSLDEADNTTDRFLSYLIAALQAFSAEIGEGAQIALKATPPAPTEAVLISLINDLQQVVQSDRSSPMRIVVLDDYHVITSQEVHEALAFLLEHLPPSVRLALTTRSDPPLPLARMRVRGEMAEVRATDLRFNQQEAADFLNQVMGLELSAEDVASLEERTEGWIAGLQVAGLALQKTEDSEKFLQQFTGSHRYVFDYMVDEVLERQPTGVQRFLLRTAILDRLTGPLCDALMASDDGGCLEALNSGTLAGPPASQQTLEQLENANLFLVPLDDERRWYRFHRLFGELLRAKLKQEVPPKEIAGLHHRASVWYEQQGMLNGAVRHAQMARDRGRLIEVLESHGMALLMQGEMTTLLDWISFLPERIIKSRARLCVIRSWIALLLGDAAQLDEWLQLADRQLADAPLDDLSGHVAAISAYQSSLTGDVDATIDSADRALEMLSSDSLGIRAVVHFVLGGAHLMRGDWGAAAEAMADAGRLGIMGGNIHVAVPALNALAGIRRQQGRLSEAQSLASSALQVAKGASGRYLPIAAGALSALAELDYERNDLQDALTKAQLSVQLAEQWGNSDTLCSNYLTLAHVHLALGNLGQCTKALERAEALTNTRMVSRQLQGDVRSGWLRLHLAQDNRIGLRRWMRSPPSAGPGLLSSEHLHLARAHLYLGDHDTAASLVDSVLQIGLELRLERLILHALITKALVLQAQGHEEEAVSILADALERAEPEGYARSFIDGGKDIAFLLKRAARRGIRPEYARSLRSAFGQQGDGKLSPVRQDGPSVLIEPLSDRELQVLRLTAAGLSNQRISDELIIAVSTVKSHLNSIYGKLGVRSRTEAAATARDLNLI